MASMLVIVFDDATKEHYYGVNDELGVDVQSGEGDWPEGLVIHAAGFNDAGQLVVTEIWESPDHQAVFMEQQLLPAFGKVGIPEPSSVTWTELEAHHAPQ